LPNLQVPHYVLRLSRTEVPSLHRHYPASSVHSNLSATPGRPACPSPESGWSSPTTPWGFPCCARFPCVRAVATTPAQPLAVLLRSIRPAISAFPERVAGSACASSFSRLTQRSLALRPAHSRCHQVVARFTKGFRYFVTSVSAPVASGWSCGRVGLSPTGKRRLITAHTHLRHSPSAITGRETDRRRLVNGVNWTRNGANGTYRRVSGNARHGNAVDYEGVKGGRIPNLSGLRWLNVRARPLSSEPTRVNTR
jgi:hypothetical protein